jgi:hypothetical protein
MKKLYKILVGNLKRRENLAQDDLGTDGRIILQSIFKKQDVQWIQLAQVSAHWQALVNTVTNLLVPK